MNDFFNHLLLQVKLTYNEFDAKNENSGDDMSLTDELFYFCKQRGGKNKANYNENKLLSNKIKAVVRLKNVDQNLLV